MGEDKLGPGSRKESFTPREAQANRIMEDKNHQDLRGELEEESPAALRGGGENAKVVGVDGVKADHSGFNYCLRVKYFISTDNIQKYHQTNISEIVSANHSSLLPPRTNERLIKSAIRLDRASEILGRVQNNSAQLVLILSKADIILDERPFSKNVRLP
jgi:hypothetical protein